VSASLKLAGVASIAVVVVKRGAPIAPFGVCADDVPIGDTTLGEARAIALAACGLAAPATKGTDDDVVSGPALVLADDLWLTRRALRAFLTAAQALAPQRATNAPAASQAAVRLRLPPSLFVSLTLPLQDLDSDDEGGATYPCAFVPAGVRMTAAEALRAPPCTIAYRELPTRVPVPRTLLPRAAGDDGAMQWPLTSTVALRVRHWLHVLRASHVAPQVWLIERALADPLRSSLRALLGVRLSAARREAAWRRQFVFRGRRCLVHPSAVIEGSVLGDDVVIGPGAVVLNSVIGAGSRLEQRTHVSQCTLGPRTFMSLNSSMQACVTFADADACANNLQGCVVGARAGLTSFVRALDTTLDADGRPGGAVRVADGDVLRDAGVLPVGACFGPGAFVGANVTVAAGRVIPAGVVVVAGDGAIVTHSDVAPGTYRTVGGRLVALS